MPNRPAFSRLLLAICGALALSTAAHAAPLAADTPSTTTAGTPFTAPGTWTLVSGDGVSTVTPPEADLIVKVVDIGPAKDAADAVAKAWVKAGIAPGYPLLLVTANPPKDGWEERASVEYDVPVADKLAVGANAYRKGDGWTVLLLRGADATLEKRAAQLRLIDDTLLPKGFTKESFAGKTAHPLDAARIEALRQFVRDAMAATGTPGVGLAFIDHGKIVWEGGEGVRELGKAAPVDAHTLFAIASNTKGMSTLLLATLVDQGRITWDEPVTKVYPPFRLGSDATTAKVELRNLVCACTGLPRKDMELIFNADAKTPASETFKMLAGTEPTSGFGEVFQYNNLMASAAGYIAGHLYYPDMELGAAYDRAMQEKIFGPLGMKDTTFSIPKMLKADHASPHDWTIDAKPAVADVDSNWTFYFARPAGGAWSSAHDVAQYVMNELSEGVLPGGKRMIGAAALLERRKPGVPIGKNEAYGMGLEVDSSYGVTLIHHGGSLWGYKSDWIAIPEAGIGAVLLTNSDQGQLMLKPFRRRLLEVLYDGRPEALADVRARADNQRAEYASLRKLLTVPPGPAADKLAAAYSSPDLGPLNVRREGARMIFDTGLWRTEMAARKNPDGTTTFFSVSPTTSGFEFVPGEKDGKKTLAFRDSQHEYLFTEK
ncbi:MAG: serine hydrolase domain-containing protein [Rudaea sp.]|uniref:serine hydrolase domain-containing protein n=1 Tax=Rudaea sp. TaxID=2136325 RepID=UPI0039E62C23